MVAKQFRLLCVYGFSKSIARMRLKRSARRDDFSFDYPHCFRWLSSFIQTQFVQIPRRRGRRRNSLCWFYFPFRIASSFVTPFYCFFFFFLVQLIRSRVRDNCLLCLHKCVMICFRMSVEKKKLLFLVTESSLFFFQSLCNQSRSIFG